MQIVKTEVKETAANVYFEVTVRVSAVEANHNGEPGFARKLGEMVDNAIKALIRR